MGIGRAPDMARVAAQAAGEMFFHNGKPCKYGHVGPRYTTNSVCVACARMKRLRESAQNAVRQQRVRDRREIAPGDYGGVPHHAPLCPPEVVTWGTFPTLLSGNWRKAA